MILKRNKYQKFMVLYTHCTKLAKIGQLVNEILLD